MIDKAEIECRFKRSAESYEENAYAQKAIVRQLAALLQTYCPLVSGRILEIGCGTGLLTAEIRHFLKDADLYINDLVDVMCTKAAERCRISFDRCITGDIEQVCLEGKFDLIVSASTFQWLANPVETFARLHSHLNEGGWMVFSTFGPDNCKELKSLTGSGLVYHTIPEMTALLSGCFETVYAEENRCVLEFDNPLEVLRHVKKTGVNAVRQSRMWTRSSMEVFVRNYTAHFSRNGRYPLTYHPQYFVCRRKD